MDKRLYEAFESIHAEEESVKRTMDFLETKVYAKRRRLFSLPRVAALVASLVLLCAFTLSALYFTPSAYIDVDINPSLSLRVNRFGRIIGAEGFNEESFLLLADTRLNNKPYDEGTQLLLDKALEMGFAAAGGLVSITIQSEDSGQESIILEQLESSVTESLRTHHAEAKSEVYAVSKDLRESAHQHNLSSAKYLAISQLQEVDETATFESCAHHSISELRRRTRAHGGGHQSDASAEEDGQKGQGYQHKGGRSKHH